MGGRREAVRRASAEINAVKDRLIRLAERADMLARGPKEGRVLHGDDLVAEIGARRVFSAAANPAVILAILAERAADQARIAHLERRETELLATTNRYLARAREAEARLSHLGEFKVGDPVIYDMEGLPIRATYRGDLEGWPLVTFDADGPGAAMVHVRPSRLRSDREGK